jgi:glyoxylase-like metal-dependent hydrolase (beta-lactamase superfamily II)
MDVPGAPLVCHVLLVETENGLVLVDSGFGSHDCDDPARRLGPIRHIIRPRLLPTETAAHHIQALGFRRDDVRHIVVTHFDLDHVGGISDFPEAQIHVTSAEALAALHPPSAFEKFRYRRPQWAHGPRLVEHGPGGETWRGFAAARSLDDIDPGIVLVPMPGHTRGHTAVAVDAGHRWVLQCGDAFYHAGTIDSQSRVPLVLRAQEELVAFDRKQLHANQERIAELNRRHEPDLLVVCSHDPTLYRHARDTA